MINNERWKDVVGYEGFYQISDRGRVKSLISWDGRKYVKKERILKGWEQKTDPKGDYVRRLVTLTKNKKRKTVKVHRLVAAAFIENPHQKEEVNHIDGNPLNNNVENLEWVTSRENSLHAWRTGLSGESLHDYEEEVVKDYKNGLFMKDILKKYGGSYAGLRTILKNNNLRIISSSERKNIYKIDKQQLVEDFESGMRNVDIAKKYNTNRNLIGTYKHKYKKGELV